MHPGRLARLLAAALAVAACAPGTYRDPHSTRAPEGGGSSTVLEGDQLGYSAALIDVLVSRVGNVEVGMTSGCPRITMRGPKSIAQPSNPRIYVNGSPASDTCVLQQLRTEDVSRVELYPTGVTTRPGYRSNAGGLILVFLRSATDARD